jgi:hypothetical protein
MAQRKLEIVISGDSTGAQRAARDTDTAYSKLGKSIQSAGRAAALAFGAAAIGGVIAIGKGLVDSVAAGRESIKVNSQTGNVIKTMGGIARCDRVEARLRRAPVAPASVQTGEPESCHLFRRAMQADRGTRAAPVDPGS